MGSPSRVWGRAQRRAATWGRISLATVAVAGVAIGISVALPAVRPVPAGATSPGDQSQFATEVHSQSPEAFWAMQESHCGDPCSPWPTVTDSSSNGLNGTISVSPGPGGVIPGETPGPFSSSSFYDFATGDYNANEVQADYSQLQGNGGTFYTWVDPEQYSEYEYEAYSNNGEYANYVLDEGDGGFSLQLVPNSNLDTFTPKLTYNWGGTYGSGPGSATIVGDQAVSSNQWSNLYFTWDSSSIDLYLNGTLIASAGGREPIYYGGSTLWMGYEVNGAMADTAMWTSALPNDRALGILLLRGLLPDDGRPHQRHHLRGRCGLHSQVHLHAPWASR